jgi:1-acyl-sn-glycerol-3-phosphate acyltransferase
MSAVRRIYYFLAGHLSWLVFGSVSLALNLVCAVLLLLPGRERRGAAVRKTICRLFGTWCAWLHATRLIYVTWNGFTPEALAGPAVYIANHPGLLDATFILARLPDTICIFKRSVMHNPALGPAALMAGYASGDAGVDLIRDVAARVAAGRSLLIFPEGTRTVAGVALNPLKPGFALIAARAHVPVRLLVIRAPRDLVPKGFPWWRIPVFPAHVQIAFLGELSAAGEANATELTARATQQLSAALAVS